MPPLSNEAGQLGELQNESMCDSTIHGEEEDLNEENSNQTDKGTTTLDDEVDDLALL